MRRVLLIFSAAAAAREDSQFLVTFLLLLFFFMFFRFCFFFYFPLVSVCFRFFARLGSQWQYFQFAKWRIQPTEICHTHRAHNITYSRVLVERNREICVCDMGYVCHAKETTAGILIILMRVLSYECMFVGYASVWFLWPTTKREGEIERYATCHMDWLIPQHIASSRR